MIDLLVIYNDDADVWRRYVVEHLDEKFHLRISAVRDVDILQSMIVVSSATSNDSKSHVGGGGGGTTGASSGSAADFEQHRRRLKELSESRAIIVVVSERHIQLLVDNDCFNYFHVISDPKRTQILLWGYEIEDLFRLPGNIANRFPRLDQWIKVSAKEPETLLLNAISITDSASVLNASPTLHRRARLPIPALNIDAPPILPRQMATTSSRDENYVKVSMASDTLQRSYPLPAIPPSKSRGNILRSATVAHGVSLLHRGRIDSMPEELAPPVPDASHRRPCQAVDRLTGVSVRRQQSKIRRFRFQIQPKSARYEEPTTIFVLFEDEVEESAGKSAEIDVLLEDDDSDENAITICATRHNPFTYSFKSPVHAAGAVQLKFQLGFDVIGTRKLTYYSLTTDVVVGISQIYLQQLSSILKAVLGSGVSTSKNGKTADESDTSATDERPAWTPSAVDRLMTRLFHDDDYTANGSSRSSAAPAISTRQIPAQAFEQIFGIYGQSDINESSKYEFPTLVHLAAKYNLRELTERLVDLPDAYLACCMKTNSGLRPEEVATKEGHEQLAQFLKDVRMLAESSVDSYGETTPAIKSPTDKPDKRNMVACGQLNNPLSQEIVGGNESLYMDMSADLHKRSARNRTNPSGSVSTPVASSCASSFCSSPSPSSAAAAAGGGKPFWPETDDIDDSCYEKMSRVLPKSESISKPKSPLPPIVVTASLPRMNDINANCYYNAGVSGQLKPVVSVVESVRTSDEYDYNSSTAEPSDVAKLQPPPQHSGVSESLCDIAEAKPTEFIPQPTNDASSDEMSSSVTKGETLKKPLPTTTNCCKTEELDSSSAGKTFANAADSTSAPSDGVDGKSSATAPQSCLRIELLPAVSHGVDTTLSSSQLELIDILTRAKDRIITISQAEEEFRVWKERHNDCLPGTAKPKKEFGNTSASGTDQRAQSPVAGSSESGTVGRGTKIKKSFSQKLFSTFTHRHSPTTPPLARSASSSPTASPAVTLHPPAVAVEQDNTISPPLQVHANAKQLPLLPVTKTCATISKTCNTLKMSIPENGQLQCGGSSCSAVVPYIDKQIEILRASSSSNDSRGSNRSNASLASAGNSSGFVDATDAFEDETSGQPERLPQKRRPSVDTALKDKAVYGEKVLFLPENLRQKRPSVDSALSNRTSRNLEILERDLREFPSPRPPPLPPRPLPAADKTLPRVCTSPDILAADVQLQPPSTRTRRDTEPCILDFHRSQSPAAQTASFLSPHQYQQQTLRSSSGTDLSARRSPIACAITEKASQNELAPPAQLLKSSSSLGGSVPELCARLECGPVLTPSRSIKADCDTPPSPPPARQQHPVSGSNQSWLINRPLPATPPNPE